jgi:hypothetical protein
MNVVDGAAEDGGAGLRVIGSPGRLTTHRLLQLETPPVQGEIYAFEGRVRYDGVEGNGYFELWNEFPDGSRYFSRTLAASGALAALEGTSDWRTFSVPFNRSGIAAAPRLLELQLILPGEGTVLLSPILLKDIGAGGLPPRFAFLWAPWALAGIICLLALIGIVTFRQMRHT